MSDEALPAAVMVVDASGKMTLHMIPGDEAEPLREALGFQSWQVDGSAVQDQHQLLDSLDAISATRKKIEEPVDVLRQARASDRGGRVHLIYRPTHLVRSLCGTLPTGGLSHPDEKGRWHITDDAVDCQRCLLLKATLKTSK